MVGKGGCCVVGGEGAVWWERGGCCVLGGGRLLCGRGRDIYEYTWSGRGECVHTYVRAYANGARTCVVLCAAEEDTAARERDDLRHDRHRERERQRRLDKAGK